MLLDTNTRRKITDDLFRAVETSTGKAEIEARLGFYTDRGHFIPGVRTRQFFGAINQLKNLNWPLVRSRHTSTDEIFTQRGLAPRERMTAPKYRKTTWIYKDEPQEKWVIKQQKTDNYDITEFGLRFSMQTESVVENAGIENLILTATREKTRTSFTDPDNIAWIDFTIANTIIPNRPTKTQYEVEVEMKEADKGKMDQFINLVEKIIGIIQQSDVPIPKTMRDTIIEKYNDLFNVQSNKLYNVYPKPVDLTWDNWDDMYGEIKYNVTEKSDGVRSFLFIVQEGVFLLQPPFNINHLGEHTDKTRLFIGSLFDCELIEHDNNRKQILIFDTLFYKMNDLRFMAFYPRIIRATELTDPAPSTDPGNFNQLSSYEFSPEITISVKPFYFFTKADELFDAVNTLVDQGIKTPWKKDGFIFTPVNEKYSTTGIYKYKPVHLLTIDFIIKNGIPQVYKGRGADGKPVMVEFSGTNKYPYNSRGITFRGKLVNSNVVWECLFDFQLGDFVTVRQRPDRTIPNKEEVAMAVWANIMDPIGPSIFGYTLDFYIRHMNLTRYKLMQKYTGKKVLDLDTESRDIVMESKYMDIDLYLLNPAECVDWERYISPTQILNYPEADPPAKFDAISCFFNLNKYTSPATIFELGNTVLAKGGKIFGMFLDLSDYTEAQLAEFKKIQFIPRIVDDAPTVGTYIQSRTIGNEDIIPMNRTVLFPSELEAIATHYGYKTSFHQSREYKNKYDSQDNALIAAHKMFVFEKVDNPKPGAAPEPVLVPKFLEGRTAEELEKLQPPPPSPPPTMVSPPYEPGEYTIESPLYQPQPGEYTIESPQPQIPTISQIIGVKPVDSPPRPSKRAPPRLPTPPSASPDPWDY